MKLTWWRVPSGIHLVLVPVVPERVIEHPADRRDRRPGVVVVAFSAWRDARRGRVNVVLGRACERFGGLVMGCVLGLLLLRSGLDGLLRFPAGIGWRVDGLIQRAREDRRAANSKRHEEFQ